MDVDRTLIAREAWAKFLHKPTPRDTPRLCVPRHPQRNATFDVRNLSLISEQRFPVELRRAMRCELPSQKDHWVRLHRAAQRRGRRLTLVQIGANAGGIEANEWIGAMVRRHGWRAALVEPVPWLYRLLLANVQRSAPTAGEELVTAHHFAVTGTPTPSGRCAFHALSEQCVGGSRQWRRRAINYTSCPHIAAARKKGVVNMDLRQMGGLAGRKGVYWSTRLMEKVEVPCVHINDLQAKLGLDSIDLLSIDTEGSDFSLLEAYDLGRPGRPLAIEYESKGFSNAQLDVIQRKLEAHGYRVMDANAAPRSVHWESCCHVIETMALRTGEEARPIVPVPEARGSTIRCDGFVATNATYCCHEKKGWWRRRTPGADRCS